MADNKVLRAWRDVAEDFIRKVCLVSWMFNENASLNHV